MHALEWREGRSETIIPVDVPSGFIVNFHELGNPSSLLLFVLLLSSKVPILRRIFQGTICTVDTLRRPIKWLKRLFKARSSPEWKIRIATYGGAKRVSHTYRVGISAILSSTCRNVILGRIARLGMGR